MGELGPGEPEDVTSRSGGAGHTFGFRRITVFLQPTVRNFLIVVYNLLGQSHPRHSIGPVLSPRAPGRLHGRQGAEEGEARGSSAARSIQKDAIIATTRRVKRENMIRTS